ACRARTSPSPLFFAPQSACLGSPLRTNRGNLSNCGVSCLLGAAVLPHGALSRLGGVVLLQPKSLSGDRFSRALFDDLLGDVRRHLFVALALHRVVGARL